MRTSKIIVAGLALIGLGSTLGPWSTRSLAGDDGVAAQYHFAGAANLAANTNFALSKRLLGLASSIEFLNLAEDKMAGSFWRGLQFKAGANPVSGLRPMLDDLLAVESAGSFGGAGKDPLGFVLAAHLDQRRAEAWQKSLASALGGSGESFATEGFSGTRWTRPGNNSIWMIAARDWTVVGRGEGLKTVSSDYLRQIAKKGRPVAALEERWVEADVDWTRLANWVPMESCPFKLARTEVEVASGPGRFHLTGTITYPEATGWQTVPWRFPKEMVAEPLCSFTAGRDLAPFLKAKAALPRNFGKAFSDQFCCWAQRGLPFQSYATWPVSSAQEAMGKLGRGSLQELNSVVSQPGEPDLKWMPKTSQIVWEKISLMQPAISPRHEKNGDYLLARLFPLVEVTQRAPDALWSQFDNQDDLVYYDWEFTGLRLRQWRLLCEMLPVLPPVSYAAYAAPAGNRKAPYTILDNWLAGLSPSLTNTVTEIKRASPNQLSVTRKAPFVLTSFELLWLSHWLTDTPAGPVDFSLLPMAKITGPGMPPH